MGKITHKPDEAHHGHDMMTGDLKRQQREEEDAKMAAKFDKPDQPGAAKSEQPGAAKPDQHGAAKAE